MVLSDGFYYQQIRLDTINTRVFADLVAKEGDANGRGLLVTLTENGLMKDTTGITLNLKWEHTSVGNQGLDNFEAVDPSKGLYKITYPTEMLNRGKIRAFIQIIDSGKLAGTRNIEITVDRGVGDDTAIASSDSFTALAQALIDVTNLESTYAPRLLSAERQLAEANNQLEYTLAQTILNKFLFYPTPRLMVNPPSVVFGAENGASTITNAKLVLAPTAGQTYLNTQFTYPNGDVKRADWNGTTYIESYPDYQYVKNVAVTTTNSFGDLTVEFTFDGTEIELIEKGQGGRYRIQVDEGFGYQLVTELTQSAAPPNGGEYLRKLTFNSRMSRRIKVEYAGVYFGGVYVGTDDNINAVTRPLRKKAIFLGDSFTEGAGGDTVFNSYATITANLLGWECWASGSGATGFIARGTDGRVKYQDRVQHDVISYNPDVVIVEGGTNDTSYDQTQLRSAVDKLLLTIKIALPNAKIYVLSNFAVQGITENITNTRDTIKASALANALPFIDSIAGITYKGDGTIVNIATGSWITGAGNIDNIQQSGNASLYTWTDYGHPSLAGHRYIAERLAGELLKVLY